MMPFRQPPMLEEAYDAAKLILSRNERMYDVVQRYLTQDFKLSDIVDIMLREYDRETATQTAYRIQRGEIHFVDDGALGGRAPKQHVIKSLKVYPSFIIRGSQEFRIKRTYGIKSIVRLRVEVPNVCYVQLEFFRSTLENKKIATVRIHTNPAEDARKQVQFISSVVRVLDLFDYPIVTGHDQRRTANASKFASSFAKSSKRATIGNVRLIDSFKSRKSVKNAKNVRSRSRV